MKRQLTEGEALQRLAAMCAAGEHCAYEMKEKLDKWEIDAAAQERILAHLKEEKYVDDERFCRIFVREKIKYSKWGSRKIEQALYQKHIDKDIRARVMAEVDMQEYADVLAALLKSKRKSVKAASQYELNGKLIRFAMSRGFTMDVIRECLECDGEDYE